MTVTAFCWFPSVGRGFRDLMKISSEVFWMWTLNYSTSLTSHLTCGFLLLPSPQQLTVICSQYWDHSLTSLFWSPLLPHFLGGAETGSNVQSELRLCRLSHSGFSDEVSTVKPYATFQLSNEWLLWWHGVLKCVSSKSYQQPSGKLTLPGRVYTTWSTTLISLAILAGKLFSGWFNSELLRS